MTNYIEEYFVKYTQKYLPDFIIRFVIRIIIYFYSLNKYELNNEQHFANNIKKLNKSTYEVEKANEQHYEVITDFFKLHLGKKLKYSSCEWNKNIKNIEEAEIYTINKYQKELDLDKLPSGSNILEIGNGWGSLCLTNAKMYPNLNFYSFSNSKTQVEYINKIILEENIINLQTWKQDIDDFIKSNNDRLYDRIVSIECIEHCRAYNLLFEKMSNILQKDGQCFIQILGVKQNSRLMDNTSWIGRNFFTGGTVVSMNLFDYFNENLTIVKQEIINGRYYSKTLDEWLYRMYDNREKIMELFKKEYGKDAEYRYQSWRLFYLMSSECFTPVPDKMRLLPRKLVNSDVYNNINKTIIDD